MPRPSKPLLPHRALCEHAFVGDAGSPAAQFARAIRARNVVAAVAAARAIGWLSLGDALDLCLLLAEKDPKRYPRAAVRWLERLLGERELEIAEVQLAASALAALQGRSSAQAVTVLVELMHRPRVERPALDSVSSGHRE